MTSPVATPDSAAELENACRVLARRRVGKSLSDDDEPPPPRRRKKKKKKTTGAFLASLLGRGAA